VIEHPHIISTSPYWQTGHCIYPPLIQPERCTLCRVIFCPVGRGKKMEYRIIKNFKENPIEIFDGFEPENLFLAPEVCGLDTSYQKIDLVDEMDKKYEEDEVGLEYKRIYDELPTRVMAFNKSTGRNESIHGYFAIMRNSLAGKPAIILFSFFEVSALRYHAYIHFIFEEE
jgi:hypothetical protein